MSSTQNQIESETLPSMESVVYARNQITALGMFGALAMIAGLVFSQWNPTSTASQWYWVAVGPLAGLIVMMNAQSKFKEMANVSSGPYMGVFIGSVSGCFVVALLVRQDWMVPASLLVVTILLSFLAWFEQNGLGMTAAVVVAALTGLTAASTLGQDSALISACIGLVMVTAAASLKVHQLPDVAEPSGLTLRIAKEEVVEESAEISMIGLAQ